MTEPGDFYIAERERIQREVCKAFRVKPWLIGLAPVPRWYRWWVKIRLPYDLAVARRRGLRRVNGKWVAR